MENLVIQINWAYFLGIVGSLILIAWYSGGRFKTIETNIEWLKETVKDLANNDKVARDNKRINAIGNASPLVLMQAGKDVLNESGFKSYIDINKPKLFKECGSKKESTAYEVQEYIFNMFDDLVFDPETDKKLKDYAYNKGINIETIRRIGAIYFRDICLEEYKMKAEDIDKHNPNGK